MAPSLHHHALFVDRLAVALSRRAVLGGMGLAAIGLRATASAATCEPRKGPDGNVCIATGGPCGPEWGSLPCCPDGECRDTAGEDSRLALPSRVCYQRAGTTCSNGGQLCRSRFYSAMGPDMCCPAGAWCGSPTGGPGGGSEGCLSLTCDCHGTEFTDWEGPVMCGAADEPAAFCLCTRTNEGAHVFANFDGLGGCDTLSTRRACERDADCPSGKRCIVRPIGGLCRDSEVTLCLPTCCHAPTPPPPPCQKYRASCRRSSECCSGRCRDHRCRSG